MNNFASLMRRADTLRRVEPDPIRAEWWVGYMRGLRRAHHGERFGTNTEHELWLAASASDDPQRAALGSGYRSGLTLQALDPPSISTTKYCIRCGHPFGADWLDGGETCPKCRLVQ